MPTQKKPKATRKLKRHADKTNARRRSSGKQPLPFNKFYGISHKRNRKEFEERNQNKKDDNIKPSPSKKRKINYTKPKYKHRDGPFGFGENMTNDDPEYQRFITDIKDANDSDDDDDIEQTDSNKFTDDFLTQTITTTNDDV